MENAELFAHIKGWGVDADPANEPTYPMKKYTGDDHKRLNYERPTQQAVDVEVLHSNERPGVTAVFGTPNPPTGISGAIRRYAFRYSEGSFAHWLPLLLADRVQMVEEVVNDFKKGTPPNLFREKGYAAEWKYNRPAVIKKGLIAAAVGLLVIAAISHKKRKRMAMVE
ncbi:hypothetical protein MKQ68_17050 [Chitinophaga horti]|uniref:Uncharacterized protein n=1 Tax=Chitinophaga horti TaxID=2920382 RepID=A0ABY6IWN8_9BACT|nr:hypothetical protein [Chitinophaga horti]UYQ91797.1 hypothetical protein MKQ68_17050 [Chitinophaga horti]